MEPDGTPASTMRGVWSRNAEGRQDSHESEGERRGNRRRGTRRRGAATAIEWRAVRPEPQAVVRSTLPEAKVVPTAPVPALLHGAVRRLVSGEAGTGDARGAAAASRGDARRRRSRPGRARRGRRRARRAAPSRGVNGGPADDAVEHGNERVVPATAVSAASRRASGARSERQRTEARGIPARRGETAQRARQGSPVAKRRAQTHRTVPHTGQRHRHHRPHHRQHQRQDRRHRDRRQRRDRHHRRRHHRHQRQGHRHQRRRHHERWRCRRQPAVLLGESGGAAAERGAAGAVRREGERAAVASSWRPTKKGERAAPVSDAARDALRPMRCSAGPGCRAAARGPRGCR